MHGTWTPLMRGIMIFIILTVAYFTLALVGSVANGNYTNPNAPIQHDIDYVNNR